MKRLDPVLEEDTKRMLVDLEGDSAVEGRSVLVTGGAGFLGSWLCDLLLKLGAQVTCLDNFSSGRLDNVSHLLGHERFRLVKQDVTRFECNDKYDFIVHAASRASPEDYQIHPIETMLANSLGSLKVLEVARRCDSKILYTSTSEVYGDAKVIPTPEDYWGNVNPIGPRSCYDEAKRFGEALFMSYYRKYGVDVRIARIFNTYGPRLREDSAYGRAVSRFISQALRGDDITVYGDGEQTRSFCYVTDMTVGLYLMLTREGVKGQVVNLGNPRETTINELAELIKRITNSRSRIVHLPPVPDDPRRRCPDISRATELLGWRPRVSLEDGLRRTVEWLKRKIES